MFTIELLDLKGDYIELTFAGEWERGPMGLYEMVCYAAHEWSVWYPEIPIPLFSEWFEEVNDETDQRQ